MLLSLGRRWGTRVRPHRVWPVARLSGGGDPVDAAQHQLKHRVQEKAGVKAAERVVESLVQRASPARLLERSGDKAVLRGLEHAAERAAESTGERVVERAAERVGERAAERIGERVAERVGERTAERVAERVGERAAERIGERAAERLGERVGERVAERTAERATERIGERAAERVAERATERAASRARLWSSLFGKRAVSSTETAATKELMRHTTRKLDEKVLGGLVSRRVGLRLGQRALIALPVLGGGFAAYICYQDTQRATTERGLAAFCFTTAAASDALDAAAHFVLAYGLLNHWDHAALHLSEHVSIGAAAVSILGAIAGELTSTTGGGAHHHPPPSSATSSSSSSSSKNEKEGTATGES